MNKPAARKKGTSKVGTVEESLACILSLFCYKSIVYSPEAAKKLEQPVPILFLPTSISIQYTVLVFPQLFSNLKLSLFDMISTTSQQFVHYV